MIDPNIITRGAELAQLQQQQNMEALGNLGGNFGKMVLGRRVHQMRQLEKPEEQQAFANKSIFAPLLNAQLKADKAAEVQALRDQQKHDADIYNIRAQGDERIANAFNKTKQGQGYGLDNSGKRQAAIENVIQQAAMTGDPGQVLIGLNRLAKTGLITPEQYQQEAAIVQAMTPEELQKYAQGSALTNKEVAPYLYQTQNNAADNAQSERNNVRTTNATLNGQQLDYQLGKDKLEQDDDHFNKPKFVKEITAPDGTVYGIYSDGSADVMSTRSGGVVKGQGGASKGMTATMQKELFETDDAITAGNSLISTMTDAIALNDKSYDGVLARERAAVAGNAWGSDDAKNTALLHSMITGNALEALKATFGSAPTEGERKILIELQGSVNEPAPVRKAIWGRAQAAAKRRLEYNQQKAEAIRNGSYTSTTYKPYVDTPSGSGVNAGQQQPKGSDTTQKAISSASGKWGI